MRLLYIAHRIPYPPNKGDKIRSYNELAFLCRHFEVDLVCFYGGPGEQDHIRKLQGICKTVSAFHRGVPRQALQFGLGLLRREPLSVALYRHGGMQRKIKRLLAENEYRHVFIFSGQMVQYLPRNVLSRTVVDLCDVDSHKWDNYADRLPFYLSWFYRMEARRLLAFEKEASRTAQACIFITDSELELFRGLGGTGQLKRLGNGVDTQFFHPGDGDYEEGRILFTGAMDYFPNEEGVAWFANEVFPAVRAKFPKARFVIAGSNPSLKVRNLARMEGVEVTGFVEDMRREQTRAHMVVVPLRIARGMQNKVLEAMACGKAAVVTSKAMGGITAENGRELMIADSPEEFVRSLELLLGDPERVKAMGQAARDHILEEFSWERNLTRELLPLLA